MKYLVKTFGCQMNEHDSEILAGMMEEIGYEPVGRPEDADAIIINTCCVRESAENRIIGYIGNLKKLKEQNPGLIITVSGCMLQQPGAAENLIKRAPFVDLVLGTHNIHRLPQLISERQGGNESLIEVVETEGDIQEELPVKRQGKIKAQVTIMYGCNNFCSYCIVPFVRGRERSRKPEAIEKEIQNLGLEGFKEVLLLGQNVNSYGLDFSEAFDFADLLERVDRIPGIERIRYMTSHPRDFTQKLVDTISKSQKVCEHFHLPIQAGSNRILKQMNRGYSREMYFELVESIREKVPKASITTDIIVGFPGETDDDFADTLDVIKRVRFDAAYTFLYSRRSGTPAAKISEQVPAEEKKKRLQILMDLENFISREINEKLVGNREEVLVEGTSKTKDIMFSGRTRTNKIVIFPGEESMIGKLVNVNIMSAKTWHLEGQIIK